ncbi:MAG: hypothetical protein ACYDAM_10520 [Leptospirales bacterium]
MTNDVLRNRILEEIQRIPETKLEEVYDFLHYFRVGLGSPETSPVSSVLPFAGAWSDMNDSTFKEFEEEIQDRRRQAFSSRRSE